MIQTPSQSQPVTAHKVTARRSVPAHITRPSYVDVMSAETYAGSEIQTAETIEKMRVAGKIAAQARDLAGAYVKPGVTTDEIDRLVHEFLCDHNAYPATLGYRGFPKSCCTSVNEVICHGIPDLRPLQIGDIVKVDVTAFHEGVHGDTCATFAVGEIDPAAQDLLDRTEKAMMRGISAAKPGRQVNVIGRVIETFAKRFGYGVVREYTGHGCHSAFHSGLIIPHYDDPRFADVIEPGMAFTIEPMLTLGHASNFTWDDGWTVVTQDGSWCAQFEHTVVITDSGTEILTQA